MPSMPESTPPTSLASATKLEVIVVCCGQPKLSMGWFHLTQLLANPDVDVTAIVEPFFLGPGKDTPGAKVFAELQASIKQSHPATLFCASTAGLPDRADAGARKPLLGLIAGRTCDAPKLFAQLIDKGATHVYVEKPGAENAEQLGAMRELAAERGVSVVVGYNKNVAAYVREGLARVRARVAAGEALPQITLEHCNEFSPGPELHAFMRGPGGEGILHNMCCHELALAVSLFGVTSARVVSVSVEPDATELVQLEDRSDFAKVGFTLELADDGVAPRPGGVAVTRLRFFADRCGGNFSRVTLSPVSGGEEEAYCLPDAAHKEWIAQAQAADPEIRSYFLQQAPDYKALKHAFVRHILSGEPGIPDGVVGLSDAEEALRLADMLVPALKHCCATNQPWVAPTPAN